MSGNPLVNQMNTSNFMAGIQNSPIMKIAQMMKSGGNPQALLQQMMGGNNSQMQQVMQMVNGKSPSDMGAMINDLAKQRGVNVKDLVSTLGVPENTIKNLNLNLE